VPKQQNKSGKTPRGKRPAIRLGAIDTGKLVKELRELHEVGGDPALERFPADDELYLVLLHAQRWAGALKQPRGYPVHPAARTGVLCATLWQYLREQADSRQLAAVEWGRAAGAPWDDFVGPLCVSSRQGALQKADRWKAEQVRQPGERRSPEVARRHAARAAAEEQAANALVRAQERRFPDAQRIARTLLQEREGLVLNDMAAYWLGELAETIDDRAEPTHRMRFVGWLESFVRAIRGHAREHGQSPARTEGARRALEWAVEFTTGG